MKYKKHIELKYQYAESELSKTTLNDLFDGVLGEIYRNLKAIEEAKKDFCSLKDFTAKDYPEFLMIRSCITGVDV